MDHEFQRSYINIIPHVEEMWDVQEGDGYCEVGTSQRPNCWKDDDDDDDGGGGGDDDDGSNDGDETLICTNCKQISD